MQTDLLRRL